MSYERLNSVPQDTEHPKPSGKARNLMVRLHRQLLKEGFSTWGFIIKVTEVEVEGEMKSIVYLENFSCPPYDHDKFKQNTLDALNALQDPRMGADANKVLDMKPKVEIVQ
jgi:hypothetical protein